MPTSSAKTEARTDPSEFERELPRRPPPPPGVRTFCISVVIPARNEEMSLERTLARVRDADVHEVIVVDGQSTDRTPEVARSSGARVLSSTPGRGRQMNAGAAAATGDVLLFLHADTMLPEGFAYEIERILNHPHVSAGAFRLRIDAAGVSFRLIEQAVCYRAKMFQWPYGDQALFMRRDAFVRSGGFPDWQVMEDYDLVRRLRKAGRIEMSSLQVATSARRWQARGTWRTSLLNQRCIAAYWLGVSPQRIARWRVSRTRGESIRRGVPHP